MMLYCYLFEAYCSHRIKDNQGKGIKCRSSRNTPLHLIKILSGIYVTDKFIPEIMLLLSIKSSDYLSGSIPSLTHLIARSAGLVFVEASMYLSVE